MLKRGIILSMVIAISIVGAMTVFGVTKSKKNLTALQKDERHFQTKDGDVLIQYWTSHLTDLQKEYGNALTEQDMDHMIAVLKEIKHDLLTYKKHHIKNLDKDKQKILELNYLEEFRKLTEIEIEHDIYEEVTDYLSGLLSE